MDFTEKTKTPHPPMNQKLHYSPSSLSQILLFKSRLLRFLNKIPALFIPKCELIFRHLLFRIGFEEEKNFHVVLNSVIAGRYHVTEYLGAAAFSKALQAHDMHTGVDVCIKIIKNNKDFFDQSLDEIKLLKHVNKHDPGDKYHILRLYDYFYFREHLLIVCELLKANLYEFDKFNRESGAEVYFTMPRLQVCGVLLTF
ncbi:DYRK-family kinase pom1 [Medicago truncatula]|uniref:DYRK-family kinase pom1 n=1 Tax=Medicago truncatula TaxID=3880 RepID=UPI0019683289|nr:DYRK-family kinase pom1 [Medicago truncatula]